MSFLEKNSDADWLSAWKKVQETLQRIGAPSIVREAAKSKNVGWNYEDGKFYLFCSSALYDWLEVPSSLDSESNIRIVKKILWPFMQKYNCKDLCYQIIK